MINDRLWLVFGLMMVTPFLFMLLPLDPTTSTIGMLGANLGMLFMIRRVFKNVANGSGLFGHKIKYQCLTCNGNKFDRIGSCVRCGSKSKRAI